MKRTIAIILSLFIAFTASTVTVKAASKPALSKTKITMLRYHSYKLELKNNEAKVKWSSKDKKIASVDKNGTVKAINAGTTKVTAKANKKSYTCTIKVVDYEPLLVLGAYGNQALTKILPKNPNLHVNKAMAGTSVQNKDLVYLDCTFKDKSDKTKHAYVLIYRAFGEQLSYHTVKTDYYPDKVVVQFRKTPLTAFDLSKCKEVKYSSIEKISKTLFKLEKIKVTKGKNFDSANEWLKL